MYIREINKFFVAYDTINFMEQYKDHFSAFKKITIGKASVNKKMAFYKESIYLFSNMKDTYVLLINLINFISHPCDLKRFLYFFLIRKQIKLNIYKI